jgi:hypothetical protein
MTRSTPLAMIRSGAVLVALIATMGLAPDTARAIPFPMSGLKPDNWGSTVAGARASLGRGYPGIASVTCFGIRMVGYPRSESTWVSGRRRYWDKLWCQGTTQAGKLFRLVHDQKERRFVVYRLTNVTRDELRGGGGATPSPQPQPEPQPQPQPQGFEWLVDKARERAIHEGQYPPTAPGVRFYYYSVEECGMQDGLTARCTLYLWKETDVLYGWSFQPCVKREILRYYAYALYDTSLGRYWTKLEGMFYQKPYHIICSDNNKVGAFVVDTDPLTGQPAPPCT